MSPISDLAKLLGIYEREFHESKLDPRATASVQLERRQIVATLLVGIAIAERLDALLARLDGSVPASPVPAEPAPN